MRAGPGESDRLAKMIEGSFLSSLKNLWNNIVVLGLEIGERLSPFVRLASRYIVELSQSFSSLLRNVSDANAFKVFTAEMAKAMHVGGEIMGAFVAWTSNTFVPQLVAIAGPAGAEFAKEFWEGFTTGASDIHELKDRLDHLNKERARISRADPRGNSIIAQRSIADLDRLIERTNQRIASKTPRGGNLLESITSIIEKNYGKMPRQSNTARPTVGGKPPSVAPNGFRRPDVVAGGSQAKTPAEIADALESLSPEAKEAAKVAKKAETVSEREAKRLATAAERVKEHLILEAKRIHDAVRTPLEAVNDELARARELLRKNVLEAEDFARLQDKLYAALDKDTSKARRPSHFLGDNFGAMTDGTAEMLVREHAQKQIDARMAAAASRREYRKHGLPDPKPIKPGDMQPGRVIKPWHPGLALKMPKLNAAQQQGLIDHENERYAEIARRDAAELSDRVPMRVGAGGSQDSQLSQKLERLGESLDENTEALKDTQSLELTAAGF